MIDLTREWFEARWEDAKNRTGKRYTPTLNVNLPIAKYFDSLTQNVAFFARIDNFIEELEDARAGLNLKKIPIIPIDKAAELSPSLDETLAALREIQELHTPSDIPLKSIRSSAHKAQKRADDILTLFWDAEATTRAAGSETDTERQRDIVQRIRNCLSRMNEDVDSPSLAVCNAPYLLLLGSAGTGKTHLLCEMTRQRIEAGMPALMFLGQAFRSRFDDALTALVHSVLPKADPTEFLTALDAYACALSTRCLISVDAINEGDRQSWLHGLPSLLETIRHYSGLAIVIGCRTPFENILIPSPSAVHLETAIHFGFPPEMQSDATEKYFRAYNIPLPEVPLLEEEFANPLFLKLFCESLERATVQRKHAQIRDIASGQRGMTYVLEFFVTQKSRVIAERLGIDASLAWKFLKNHFASRLAALHVDALLLPEATAMADTLEPALPSGSFLRALIDEDILAEDVSFDGDTAQEIVRFTYQKFADHLIARHLLASQLDVTNRATIKESLSNPAKLGSYFQNHSIALGHIGIVQAMMIEFPTRIKNTGELFNFLDWDGFPIRLCEAFLEGLYWRDPQSINKSTSKLVERCLHDESLKNDTLNVLVGLSVKPQHPFRAERLDAFLLGRSLIDRDLFWSEYLRESAGRGTPGRILVWAEHSAPKKPDEDFARAYIIILKWFLTSTQRGFRDRATHALFHLGRIYPKLLFRETLRSLPLNDPYVPQRMLAASYGVTMSIWQTTQFRRNIIAFARELYEQMFARNAKHGTTHVLTRDYAQRIIELGLLIRPTMLSNEQRRLITPPFHYGGIRQWGKSDDRDEGKYREGDSPLGMDFENYTLGRLVKERSPYDNQHAGYQKVKQQIFWRIYDLGYTLKAFSVADREIARRSWYQEQRGRDVGKTDRYGKKYAWIAFYELAGYRMDLGLLDRNERISDVDIDPSFPETPNFPAIFEHSSWIEHRGSVREWLFSGYKPAVENGLVLPSIASLAGAWILLHGHTNRESNDKTIFAFFDGIFVAQSDLQKAIHVLCAMGYPGSQQISRPESEYYTYAGEVPWADTWQERQYPASISANGMEVMTELPVRDYSWESYHSLENQAGGLSFPSKELGEDLKLYVQIPKVTTARRGTSDIATVPVVWGDPYRNYESLLFIRQDFLDDYLQRKKLAFLMFVWGERRGNYHRRDMDVRTLEGQFEIKDALHQQGFVYERGAFTRFS